jgi:hypothetical protein
MRRWNEDGTEKLARIHNARIQHHARIHITAPSPQSHRIQHRFCALAFAPSPPLGGEKSNRLPAPFYKRDLCKPQGAQRA